MVWRRLFKGKTPSTTTTTVEPELASTPPPARNESPRIGGFSFEGAAAPRPTGPQATAEAATVEAPVPTTPDPDTASVVRRKAGGRRTVRSADRGVEPVFVPSLRARALAYRLAADTRSVDDPEGALPLWQAYLDLCPEDGEAWFVRGQCLLATARPSPAREAFLAAREHDPRNGLAAGALGYLCALAGERDEAVRHYREAVELRPRCPDMLTGLAAALDAAGQADAAAAIRARLDGLPPSERP